MALRPPSTPRASQLPSPSGAGSTPSSLPTSNRRRLSTPSTSNILSSRPTPNADDLDNLQQVLKSNDTSRYESSMQRGGGESPTPNETKSARTLPNLRRPSTVNLRGNSLGISLGSSGSNSRPTTPLSARGNGMMRSKTPTSVFGSSVGPRPLSRSTNNSVGLNMKGLQVGDEVKFEVAGIGAMEGTIRFLGEVDGKDGNWGGVELDSEWSGKGKNDGSVKGVQYFACPPQCGLFLPLQKITKKLPVVPQPQITAGSRASKYVGLKASELTTNRRSAAMLPPASPTKGAPRRSLAPPSPEKVVFPSSASSTPRAIRTARPSIGGYSSTNTPRKSFGIPSSASSTPRASTGNNALSNSVKRPGSSLRTNSIPDVPALPHSYALKRSVTPSSSRDGRATPSTPSLARRQSEISSSLSHSQSRPTTPSVRSFSRQSFASSSVSRQSIRTRDEEDVAEFKQQALEARERESQVRTLLEGSEKVGRDLEDQVAELKDRLKAKEKDFDLLESRTREKELARLAGVDEDEEMKKELKELNERVEELQASEATKTQKLEKLQREWNTKSAAKEGEIESLRERLEAATKGGDEEKADLQRQLEQLRSAGQALCETYEERIAEIEIARLESVDLAETLAAKLETLQLGARDAAIERGETTMDDGDRSESPVSPTRRLGSSAGASAADMINAESAQADLEHLRAKVGTLEEQLEEARMHLESEVNDSRKRRTKHQESEAQLRKDIKTMKDALDRASKTETRLTARISELEAALQESQATLEEERSELEGLRHDAIGGASAGIADELKRANKLINSLKKDLEEGKKDMAEQTVLIEQLKSQLEASPRQRSSSPTPAPTQDSPSSSHLLSESTGRASSHGRQSIGSERADASNSIDGLKSIIRYLEEDKAQLVEKNDLLSKETEQLKNSQRALEVTVEKMISEMSKDGKASPKILTSPSVERESSRQVEELKTKLREVEKKAEREIKVLHQEVTELESLVESKIYREDELETELEKYKSLASKAAASSKPTTASNSNGASGKPRKSVGEDEDGGCELCGEKDHDLDSCPIFAGNSSPTKSASSRHAPKLSVSSSTGTNEAWCDDCEEYGHALEDCPLANDIF